jgi:hypothetical protein
MREEPVERFRPTGGLVSGVLALGFVVTVVVLGLADLAEGFPLPVVTAALVMGVLVWAAMLRPRVWATADELVLRNMLTTAFIPLAAIEQVVVRQVMAVRAGERRYVSAAIGKPRSRPRPTGWGRSNAAVAPFGSVGGRRRELPNAGFVADRREPPYADFVADRISHLAESARARQGIALCSAEQQALAAGVRRTRAWPEIAALVLACLLFVASLVV